MTLIKINTSAWKELMSRRRSFFEFPGDQINQIDAIG